FPCILDRDDTVDLAGEDELAVPVRAVARNEEQVSRLDGRHVEADRRRRLGKHQTQLDEPLFRRHSARTQSVASTTFTAGARSALIVASESRSPASSTSAVVSACGLITIIPSSTPTQIWGSSFRSDSATSVGVGDPSGRTMFRQGTGIP